MNWIADCLEIDFEIGKSSEHFGTVNQRCLLKERLDDYVMVRCIDL